MAQAPPCPYCGAFSYRLRDRHLLTCEGCGHEFDVRRDLCPSCGHLNRADATFCSHCQDGLRGDAVDRIIETRGKTRRQWDAERHTVATEQKKREADSSQRRTEAFMAEERARRESFARAQAESERRERRILLIVGILGAIVVLLLIAASLIFTFVLPLSGEDDEATLMPAAQNEGKAAYRRPELVLEERWNTTISEPDSYGGSFWSGRRPISLPAGHRSPMPGAVLVSLCHIPRMCQTGPG